MFWVDAHTQVLYGYISFSWQLRFTGFIGVAFSSTFLLGVLSVLSEPFILDSTVAVHRPHTRPRGPSAVRTFFPRTDVDRSHTLFAYRRRPSATLSAYERKPSAHSFRIWTRTVRKILESAVLIVSVWLLQSSSVYSLFFCAKSIFQELHEPLKVP